MKISRNFSPSCADARDLWQRFLDKPQLYSRQDEFNHLIREASNALQKLCNSKDPVLFLSAAGTGALECALAALPDDSRITVIRNGYFGQRLFEIAQFHHENVVAYDVLFGQSFNEVLEVDFLNFCVKRKTNVIVGVHLESSSTVLNDVALMGKIAEEIDALTIIDGVSSIGAVPCQLHEWGIDCFVASAYKALLCPAGLSFIIANDRFLSKVKKRWSYYFDLAHIKSCAEKESFLWSPNVLGIQCLNEVVKSILDQGQNTYFQDLHDIVKTFRERISTGGLEILGEAAILSPCYTTIELPEASADLWLKHLKDEYGIVIGKGCNESADRYLRIGHYPNTSLDEFQFLADSLIDTLLHIER